MVLAHIAGVPVEEALFATPGLLAGAGAFAMNWRARRAGTGTKGAAADEPRPVVGCTAEAPDAAVAYGDDRLAPQAQAQASPTCLNGRPASLHARSDTRRP